MALAVQVQQLLFSDQQLSMAETHVCWLIIFQYNAAINFSANQAFWLLADSNITIFLLVMYPLIPCTIEHRASSSPGNKPIVEPKLKEPSSPMLPCDDYSGRPITKT